MQDRYAGDVGDFLTYGLLRWLVTPVGEGEPQLSLGVVWYLTRDESHNADGKHVGYLDPRNAAARALRPLDADLYARLGRVVASGERSVAAVEREGALPPGARTYRRALDYADLASADRRQHRTGWVAGALDATAGCDVVFVDPDNGLRPRRHRMPRHRKKAEKHAYIDELIPFAARGQSLVAYHHADRSAPVREQVHRRLADLARELPTRPLAAVRASRGSTRLFLVVPAPAHTDRLAARLRALESSPWARELEVCWPSPPPGSAPAGTR